MNKESSAHLLLLSKFRKGDFPDRFYGVDYWEAALKEKAEKAIKNFIREGLLEPAGLYQKIDLTYKLSDLKPMLKERGLKVSGIKADLIKSLIDNDEDAMSKTMKEINLYQCTPNGMQLVEKYLSEEENKRESIEREVMELLSQKEYSKAVQAVAQYEASQVFSRGLNMDWKNYDGKKDIELLKYIFNLRPSILQDIDDILLEQLRLPAAMMLLWGKNTAKQWLPDDLNTGIHLDGDTACRMLVFYARHLGNIKQNKEAIDMGIRIRSFIIHGSSDSCPECKIINGKEYLCLEDLPELPYAKCTHEKGCRCILLPNIL